MGDLLRYKDTLDLIEAVHRKGLRLIPSGKLVTVKAIEPPPQGYDQEETRLMVAALAGRRGELIALTSDQEALRQELAEAQQRMAKAYGWLMDHLDVWDRLEKAYRALWPADTRCVCGSALTFTASELTPPQEDS